MRNCLTKKRGELFGSVKKSNHRGKEWLRVERILPWGEVEKGEPLVLRGIRWCAWGKAGAKDSFRETVIPMSFGEAQRARKDSLEPRLQ